MSNQIFLLKELVQRDFQSRYAGSLLGLFWPFLLPLWQLLLFSFVFSTVLKIPLVGERTENFGLFLFCGLLPWMAIQEGITRSATAVTDNASLVKNLRFEPAVLVLAAVLGGVLQEGIAMAVFLAVLAALGELSLASLPILLVALPLQIAVTLGLGLLLCCVHTLFRDTAQLVSMVMMGWFYLTPIVYPLALMPERVQKVIRWNPLTTVVDLYRQAFLAGEIASFEDLGRLAAVALALLLAGRWLFSRLQHGFADEV